MDKTMENKTIYLAKEISSGGVIKISIAEAARFEIDTDEPGIYIKLVSNNRTLLGTTWFVNIETGDTICLPDDYVVELWGEATKFKFEIKDNMLKFLYQE